MHELVGSRVVLTGVGKSYDAARLGASLLQSVGVTAVSIHATDMLHGGLNFLPQAGSAGTGVVIALSHSGETREVLEMIPHVKKRAALIGITGNGESTLARQSDAVLAYTISRDGSKHGTIPAASVLEQVTWLTKITCDLADQMTAEELGAGHPGGALGAVYEQTEEEE